MFSLVRIFSVYMWSLFNLTNHTQSMKFNFLYVVPGLANNLCHATLGTKASVMQINCKQLT